jgi:hypothetical protein
LATKRQAGADSGFAPVWLPPFLFDFQAALVEWAIREGRAAIFADCGLGKTPMQLVWAENVVRQSNRPVLILTPLAVGAQSIREAEKFGISARRSQNGTVGPGITITNYERLDRFTASDFAGVVCDESSILKSFDGARRAAITEFLRTVPYRLCCTATAAPNDYIELGTHSEALGHLGFMDMLARFFVNDQNTSDTKRRWRRTSGKDTGGAQRWRFKGHAEEPFWRWVCSWARAVRRPSDLGYEDARLVLPALIEQEHTVKAASLPDGMLFSLPAAGLWEQRAERRRTLAERCERVAELVINTDQPALVWCHLNAEGDRLASLIPGAAQVAGGDPDDEKESKLLAFADGGLRVLVTKPKIGAWGLNFQRCAHVVTFPSHSYEQYYQGVRRCWRFGQDRSVTVDIVATEGEAAVVANLRRKAVAADRMFAELVRHMAQAQALDGATRYPHPEVCPPWLS